MSNKPCHHVTAFDPDRFMVVAQANDDIDHDQFIRALAAVARNYHASRAYRRAKQRKAQRLTPTDAAQKHAA